MPRPAKNKSKREEKECKAFAGKLKKRAKGITCEDCPYVNWFPPSTWGTCLKNVSITGEFLQTSKSATACPKHPRVQELKKASSENRS